MQFTKSQISKGKYVFLLVIAIIYLLIVFVFHLNFLEATLLLTSVPFFLWLLRHYLPDYFNKVMAKSIKKQRETIYNEVRLIKRGKKEGKKMYKRGTLRQHTIFAKDSTTANQIYSTMIKPFEKLNPNKVYFYYNDKNNSL